jgi:uncharacterized membrane protein
MQLTKRSTVAGLPIGPRHTDWAQVGKLGALGLGAASTAAGGVAAKRAGGKLKASLSKGKQTIARVANAAEQASSLARAVGGPVSSVAGFLGTVTGSSDGQRDGEGNDTNLKKLRLIIKESIDVGVPLESAYNQWTQFTELPKIMKGPKDVEQEEDDETRWTAKIGPSRRRWTAEIVEQVPDKRIVWASTDGTENRGVVTFHRLDDDLTRIQVEMEYFPQGFVEKVGNIFLAARRRVRKDLRLYKHYLELAGSETGAWRGEISGDEQKSSSGRSKGSAGSNARSRQRSKASQNGRGRSTAPGRQRAASKTGRTAGKAQGRKRAAS